MGRRNKGYRASRALASSDLDRLEAYVTYVSANARHGGPDRGEAIRYFLWGNDAHAMRKLEKQRRTFMEQHR